MASGVRGASGDCWATADEVPSLSSVSWGVSTPDEPAELTLNRRGGGLRWIGRSTLMKERGRFGFRGGIGIGGCRADAITVGAELEEEIARARVTVGMSSISIRGGGGSGLLMDGVETVRSRTIEIVNGITGPRRTSCPAPTVARLGR